VPIELRWCLFHVKARMNEYLKGVPALQQATVMCLFDLVRKARTEAEQERAYKVLRAFVADGLRKAGASAYCRTELDKFFVRIWQHRSHWSLSLHRLGRLPSTVDPTTNNIAESFFKLVKVDMAPGVRKRLEPFLHVLFSLSGPYARHGSAGTAALRSQTADEAAKAGLETGVELLGAYPGVSRSQTSRCSTACCPSDRRAALTRARSATVSVLTFSRGGEALLRSKVSTRKAHPATSQDSRGSHTRGTARADRRHPVRHRAPRNVWLRVPSSPALRRRGHSTA
jgi:hypothetical protein